MTKIPDGGRPAPDSVLTDIADYVLDTTVGSAEAYAASRLCMMDALGCGMAALAHPACTKLLGPIVPGTVVPNGAHVPGTPFQLDPVTKPTKSRASWDWKTALTG
jgi:2-methylcitrate dehydratase